MLHAIAAEPHSSTSLFLLTWSLCLSEIRLPCCYSYLFIVFIIYNYIRLRAYNINYLYYHILSRCIILRDPQRHSGQCLRALTRITWTLKHLQSFMQCMKEFSKAQRSSVACWLGGWVAWFLHQVPFPCPSFTGILLAIRPFWCFLWIPLIQRAACSK